MNKDSIRKKCIEILCCLGIIVDDDVDIDLSEYEIDSTLFVSFIVEVEREFNILIPDELPTIDSLSSLNGFCIFIEEQMSI